MNWITWYIIINMTHTLICLLRLDDCGKDFPHTLHLCGRCFSWTCRIWMRSLSLFSKDLQCNGWNKDCGSLVQISKVIENKHRINHLKICLRYWIVNEFRSTWNTDDKGTSCHPGLRIWCTWDVYPCSTCTRRPSHIVHTCILRCLQEFFSCNGINKRLWNKNSWKIK